MYTIAGQNEQNLKKKKKKAIGIEPKKVHEKQSEQMALTKASDRFWVIKDKQSARIEVEIEESKML